MKILQGSRLDGRARIARTESVPCRQSIVPAPNVSSKKYADAVHAGHGIRAGLLGGIRCEAWPSKSWLSRMRCGKNAISNEPRVTAAGRSSESWQQGSLAGGESLDLRGLTCQRSQTVYNNSHCLHIQVMHVGPYAPSNSDP